ncbi:hypothetical protein BIX78_00965 [Mycoplasmoides pneumoniae]|uniref:MPN312 family protein n=1 Tax=Mycoplasmoides pneumoniae TaxID=2104 RepID=UPI000BF9E48A|nr:hypothetical protein [Mycoplasmoides pneumoniae]PFH41827.1 hypothetical protein BIX78_00965 [Mycoplasmoides pneumoniae]
MKDSALTLKRVRIGKFSESMVEERPTLNLFEKVEFNPVPTALVDQLPTEPLVEATLLEKEAITFVDTYATSEAHDQIATFVLEQSMETEVVEKEAIETAIVAPAPDLVEEKAVLVEEVLVEPTATEAVTTEENQVSTTSVTKIKTKRSNTKKVTSETLVASKSVKTKKLITPNRVSSGNVNITLWQVDKKSTNLTKTKTDLFGKKHKFKGPQLISYKK